MSSALLYKLPSFTPSKLRDTIERIWDHTATRFLFDKARHHRGRSLNFKLASMRYPNKGEYCTHKHEIKLNRDLQADGLFQTSIHELRHAWQETVMPLQSVLKTDPYSLFLYQQIQEADAHAFENLSVTKPCPDSYHKTFNHFLFDRKFIKANNESMDMEGYRLSHLLNVKASKPNIPPAFGTALLLSCTGAIAMTQTHNDYFIPIIGGISALSLLPLKAQFDQAGRYPAFTSYTPNPDLVDRFLGQLILPQGQNEPMLLFPEMSARFITEKLMDLYCDPKCRDPQFSAYAHTLNRVAGRLSVTLGQ